MTKTKTKKLQKAIMDEAFYRMRKDSRNGQFETQSFDYYYKQVLLDCEIGIINQ